MSVSVRVRVKKLNGHSIGLPASTNQHAANMDTKINRHDVCGRHKGESSGKMVKIKPASRLLRHLLNVRSMSGCISAKRSLRSRLRSAGLTYLMR